MIAKIKVMDGTGDSVLCEYDTEDKEAVHVAKEELSKFFDECIAKYGKPVLWAKNQGEKDHGIFDIKKDSMFTVEEIIVQKSPIVGG